MKNFIIESRYEYWTNQGKEFSNWFVLDSGKYSEKDGNEKIKNIKKAFADIDKKTKLKHEYRLSDYETYESSQKELNKEVKKLQKQQEKYYSSQEYKELCKKKRESAKDLKEKQNQYKKEHSI